MPATLYPQEDSLYPFLLEVDPRAKVRMAGLGELKKCSDIENRTRDLAACSIVPKRTTLPRPPRKLCFP
jgi:hypothetical protein